MRTYWTEILIQELRFIEDKRRDNERLIFSECEAKSNKAQAD